MAAGWRARPAGRRCRTARRATKTSGGSAAIFMLASLVAVTSLVSNFGSSPGAHGSIAPSLSPWMRRRNRFAPHATTDRCPSPSGPSRSLGLAPSASAAWSASLSPSRGGASMGYADFTSGGFDARSVARSRPRLQANSGRHPGRAAAQPTEPALPASWRRHPPAAHARRGGVDVCWCASAGPCAGGPSSGATSP